MEINYDFDVSCHWGNGYFDARIITSDDSIGKKFSETMNKSGQEKVLLLFANLVLSKLGQTDKEPPTGKFDVVRTFSYDSSNRFYCDVRMSSIDKNVYEFLSNSYEDGRDEFCRRFSRTVQRKING